MKRSNLLSAGRRTALMALITASVISPLVLANAETWNANTDFTTLNNNLVNGVWSYGYVNGSGTGAALMNHSTTTLFDYTGLWDWNYTGDVGGVLPLIYKNTTGTSFGVDGPPPGMLALHPGNYIPFIMFTAPSSADYQVSVTFTYTGGGGGANPSVSKNMPWGGGGPVGVWNQPVSTSSPVVSYNNTLSLNAGENLVFAVSQGLESYGGDQTVIDLVVAVPEPGSVALMGLGGLGLLLVGFRRRN